MSDYTVVVIWVIKIFFCIVLLCIVANSSEYLLLLLGPYHFCPLLCPSLHERYAHLPHCRQILYQLSHKEDIKTGWKEYIEVYKKDLHNPDNHDAVITHLEPELLECEVKWALGSITTNKASGGNGILLELFQILKDAAVKVLHSICQQLWKTQQWSQDWKSSVFIPIPKKGNAKECSNYCTIALISHASTEKAMATYSSTLAWKIPWMEEPCRLQSMGSLRVGHN